MQEDVWYFDSGCTRHMTKDKKCLSDFKEKNGPKVRFGNKATPGQIKGYGTLVKNKLTIRDVAYVEGLKYNLLSTSQFCDQGYRVIFEKDGCTIETSDHRVVLTGMKIGSLFCVDWSKIEAEVCLLTHTRAELNWIWHQKIGHLNFDTMNKLVKEELVVGLPKMNFKKDTLCDACQKGKQVKMSFKSKVKHSTERVLQLLHMDLFGPVPTISISGKKYTLVVIDDYS